MLEQGEVEVVLFILPVTFFLLAAGGGGGASAGYNGSEGQPGTSGSSSVGKDSYKSRRGGTGGQPGQCINVGASFHGGVGAGWVSQGCAGAHSSHGERGGSRVQGWIGGRAGRMNSGNNGEPPPGACLLYTSPSPRDGLLSRMPSSA